MIEMTQVFEVKMPDFLRFQGFDIKQRQ